MTAYTNSQRIMQGIHTDNAKDHQQEPPSQPPHEHPNSRTVRLEERNGERKIELEQKQPDVQLLNKN